MDYSRSILLYQDKPAYGLFLKLIIVVVPAVLLVTGIYLLSLGDSSGGLALLVEASLVGFVFWVVFPRSYQVYEDHLRIVLGGPFSVKVGFAKIEAIAVNGSLTFSVNFVTRLTKNYVKIARKGGMAIAITPRDGDLFVENANQALSRWKETRPDQGLLRG